jgi:hypothetical protein
LSVCSISTCFVGELHPVKRKKIKQEVVSDVETAEHGEEHSRKKKKKKIKSEPVDGESMACGKKLIIRTLHVAHLVIVWSQQHTIITLYVYSGGGVEVKEEEAQMQTWEAGECNLQVVQKHCSITSPCWPLLWILVSIAWLADHFTFPILIPFPPQF